MVKCKQELLAPHKSFTQQTWCINMQKDVLISVTLILKPELNNKQEDHVQQYVMFEVFIYLVVAKLYETATAASSIISIG